MVLVGKGETFVSKNPTEKPPARGLFLVEYCFLLSKSFLICGRLFFCVENDHVMMKKRKIHAKTIVFATRVKGLSPLQGCWGQRPQGLKRRYIYGSFEIFGNAAEEG